MESYQEGVNGLNVMQIIYGSNLESSNVMSLNGNASLRLFAHQALVTGTWPKVKIGVEIKEDSHNIKLNL